MNTTLANLLKVVIGLGIAYWVCITLLVLAAHAGISKGEHPMYAHWVSLHPAWASLLLLMRIALFGLGYWLIASKWAVSRTSA